MLRLRRLGAVGEWLIWRSPDLPHLRFRAGPQEAGPGRGIDTSLPPLFKRKDIFIDLVKNANKYGWLEDLVSLLRGRKLRFADLCT